MEDQGGGSHEEHTGDADDQGAQKEDEGSDKPCTEHEGGKEPGSPYSQTQIRCQYHNSLLVLLVFWIRIRIDTNADPDPVFQVNAGPDPGIFRTKN